MAGSGTVIDSFFVELGIDASKFTKGQQEALAAFKKTGDEAKKRAKEIEDDQRRALNMIGRIRNEAIGLIAGLAGASGLKNFIANTISTDAAVGRLSRNIGVSVKELSKWQGVAEMAGGDAREMATSFKTLSDTFAGWKIGQVNPLVADLRAISTAGGKIIDVNKGPVQALRDLADNLKAIHDRDKPTAGVLGSRLPIDAATFDVLIRGSKAIDEMLDRVERLGHATEQSAEAARKLQEVWGAISITFRDTGRIATPILARFLDGLNEYMIGFNAYWSGNSDLAAKQRGKMWDRFKETIGGAFGGGTATPPDIKTNRSRRGLNDLPLKPGAASAGDTSLGVIALAHDLKTSVAALKQITATNDAYHAGTNSKHAQGLGLDFTLTDPAQAAAVSAALRAKLAAMGVDAKVLDEYTNPSSRSTAGHIHVGFGSQEAAALYASRSGSGSTSTVNVGTVNVTTQATDADGIARDIRGSFGEYLKITGQAEYGQN